MYYIAGTLLCAENIKDTISNLKLKRKVRKFVSGHTNTKL